MHCSMATERPVEALLVQPPKIASPLFPRSRSPDTARLSTPSISIDRSAESTAITDGHRPGPSTRSRNIPSPTASEDWQLSKAPKSLTLVLDDTSPEIRRVVQTFWEQSQVVQASASSFQLQPTTNDRPEPSSSTLRPLSIGSVTDSELSALKSPSESARKSSISSASSNSIDLSPDKGKTPIRVGASGGDAKHARERSSRRSMLRNFVRGATTGMTRMHSPEVHIGIKALAKKPLERTLTRTATMTVECASCFENIPAPMAVSLVCQHYYCSDCFTHLIRTAMQHENFWPPKCCLEEIPRKTILKTIPPKMVKDFGIKEREFATPPKDRWYCTNTSCGLWFQVSSDLGSYKRCPHCRYEMCVHCRGKRHQGTDRCAQDRGLQALETEAELEGWRSCGNCGAIIERNRGCRHITCTCKAEFCYICGARWRTCACTEEDERRRQEGLRVRREAARREEHERHLAAEAEEAELQAALQAVAESERKEREREMAAEQRAYALMEDQRLKAIITRYAKLREELQHLHEYQVAEERRGHAKAVTETLRLLMVISRQQEQLEIDVATKRLECEYRLHATRSALEADTNAANARHVMEGADMHRKLARYRKEGRMSDPELRHCRESVLARQMREISNIQKRYLREIKRLDWQLRNAEKFPAFVKTRHDLELEEQRTRETLARMEEQKETNEKWLAFAENTRPSLLDEDEARVRDSGADVPGTVAMTFEELMQSLGEDQGPVSPTADQFLDSDRDEVHGQRQHHFSASARSSFASGRPSDVSDATTLSIGDDWPMPPSNAPPAIPA